MDIDKKQFKKMFPHLAREMEGKTNRISIASIRSDRDVAEKLASKQFEGYDPDVVDFLRRCDNRKQAEEIIDYLERKRELTPEYAERLRKQLRKKGVRSFGPKKKDDYYIRQAGL